jgi:ATP-dependent DNA helicase RecQ
MKTAVAGAVRELLGDQPLRPGQMEAIEAALASDTVAVLATGLGKTLVYHVVGRLTQGTTVVVSPTIALQADQLAALRERDPDAVALTLNSALGVKARRALLQDLSRGRVDFLLLTPEQLMKGGVQDALAAGGVGLVVIDEAHCVSSWGHDFRPDYLALAAALHRLGRPRVLALTATASPRTRAEIVRALKLRHPRVVVGQADRPEIWFGARLCADVHAADLAVTQVLDEHRTATGRAAVIVYVATRRRAEELAALLSEGGHPAVAYHGALPTRVRDRVHSEFRSGAAHLIVATSAFGLGVDRPDVRLVLHADPPESLDEYYQEAGRAGRDGAPAAAVLLTRPDGYGLRRYFAAATGPSRESLVGVLRALGPEGTAPRRIGDMAERAHISRAQARQALNALLAVGAVSEHRRGLSRIGSAEDDVVAGEALRLADAHRVAAESGVELVRRYAETTGCRRRLILELLGEPAYEPCGNCDNCDAGHGGRVDDVPFPIGSSVSHAEWGRGTVEQYEEDRITVRFDREGFKTLALDVAMDRGLLSTLDRT